MKIRGNPWFIQNDDITEVYTELFILLRYSVVKKEVRMMNKRNSNSRRGTMLIEAAIVLPLLLLLTFGGIKYGWLFFKWQQTTNVARHAVRYAVRPSVSSAEAVTLIDTLMADVNLDGTGYTRTVTGGASVGAPVVVEIRVPVASVDILKIPLLPVPETATLTARLTMSKEGP